MNQDCQSCHSFALPRHARCLTLVTSSPLSQHSTKWNPAGHTVQVLLAEHRTVIGTFICPPVVREGMSNNRLTHTTGTLERPQQLWAAFHVGAEWGLPRSGLAENEIKSTISLSESKTELTASLTNQYINQPKRRNYSTIYILDFRFDFFSFLFYLIVQTSVWYV